MLPTRRGQVPKLFPGVHPGPGRGRWLANRYSRPWDGSSACRRSGRKSRSPMVSNVVSFASVRIRLASFGQRPARRSRTVAILAERLGGDLESVLGSHPREFESRILRQLDLCRHRRPRRAPGAACENNSGAYSRLLVK